MEHTALCPWTQTGPGFPAKGPPGSVCHNISHDVRLWGDHLGLCTAVFKLAQPMGTAHSALCDVGGHGTPLFLSTEGTAGVFTELERITIPPAHEGTGKHWISCSLSWALILLAFLFKFSIAVTLTVQPSLSTLKRVSRGSVNNENPWVLFNSLNSLNKHLLNTYYVPVLLDTRNPKMNKPYTLAHKILNLVRESIKERIFNQRHGVEGCFWSRGR